MANKATKLTIAGIMYTVLFAGTKAKIFGSDGDNDGVVVCGTDRWDVKMVSDEEKENIKARSKTATIEFINELKRPAVKVGGQTPRQPEELQVYTLKHCVISYAKIEDDNDIHLVLETGDNKHTMVAEIPDPECEEWKQSRFKKEIAATRAAFLRYQQTYWNYTFTVKGVIFFDKVHQGIGHGPNHAELHPILSLKQE